jgi:hypothetical protein
MEEECCQRVFSRPGLIGSNPRSRTTTALCSCIFIRTFFLQMCLNPHQVVAANFLAIFQIKRFGINKQRNRLDVFGTCIRFRWSFFGGAADLLELSLVCVSTVPAIPHINSCPASNMKNPGSSWAIRQDIHGSNEDIKSAQMIYS